MYFKQINLVKHCTELFFWKEKSFLLKIETNICLYFNKQLFKMTLDIFDIILHIFNIVSHYRSTYDFLLELNHYLSQKPSNIKRSDMLHKNSKKELKSFQSPWGGRMLSQANKLQILYSLCIWEWSQHFHRHNIFYFFQLVGWLSHIKYCIENAM